MRKGRIDWNRDPAGAQRGVIRNCPFNTVFRKNRNTVASLQTQGPQGEEQIFDAQKKIVYRNTRPLAIGFELERVHFPILLCRLEEEICNRSNTGGRCAISILFKNS